MQNHFGQPNLPLRLIILIVLGGLTAILGFYFLAPNQSRAAAGQTTAAGTPNYLPMIRRDPTPTPPPVPQVVQTINLPGAACSNVIGVNETSGYVYVGNGVSHDISVLKNRSFIKNLPAVGVRPTSIISVPSSKRTYVTHVTDQGNNDPQIAALEDDQIVAMLADYFEPYAMAFNQTNGLLYVTDLDSTLSIFNGATLVAHLTLETPSGQKSGWPLTVAVDNTTGLVYVPSWERGILYVIDGTSIVNTFQGGWGTRSMAIDSVRGFIYLAHSDPNGTYPYNISVFERGNTTMTHLSTAPNAQMVAVDPSSGYAYFANQKGNSITVMRGRQLIGTVAAGKEPWAVAVNPNTGYAYVASRGDLQQEGGTGEVTVLLGTQVIARLNGGYRPWAVAVNAGENEVYVLNRGSYIYIDEVKRQFEYCQQAAVTVIR